MISFGSIFNPERNIHSRHVESGIINPENNLERLNANQAPHQLYNLNDILGRDIITTGLQEEDSKQTGFGEQNDCNSLFSDKEIADILKKAGRPDRPPFIYTMFNNKPEFDVYIYNNDRLVINNKNCTNDTTVIFEDGSAKHIGSEHETQIAEKGTCVDVVEEAKRRYSKSGTGI